MEKILCSNFPLLESLNWLENHMQLHLASIITEEGGDGSPEVPTNGGDKKKIRVEGRGLIGGNPCSPIQWQEARWCLPQ